MIPQTGTCAVAFKEWSGVCDALTEGRQSIILRKGGIREGSGPGRFVPEYDEFWLYPTGVHQAQQGLRTRPFVVPPPHHGPDGSLAIRALARVAMIGYLDDESKLSELEPFHVLTEETVRKRYHYRTPGLWILVARIWRRANAFAIMEAVDHAGCKTWVPLDAALSTSDLTPAVDDESWSERLQQLGSIVAVNNLH
ncbi:MAG: DUF1802 family protein [Isosphaeraceae bacterium]